MNRAGVTENKMRFAVKMSMDQLYANVVIRADGPMTIGDLVEALEDIALQYRELAEEDFNGDH